MAFAPNGLLGPSTASLEITSNVDFKLNGWSPDTLGSKSTPSDEVSLMTEESGGTFSSNQSGASLWDDSVGNKSSPRNEMNATFVLNGLLEESQEDDMPDAAELIKPYFTSKTAQSVPCVRALNPHISSSTSVRATTYDGNRVYFKRKMCSQTIIEQRTSISGNPYAHLLEVPVHRMLDELSATTAATITDLKSPLSERNDNESQDVEDTLWVDRYRPQRYTDLIGNERVARDVMSWVKQWDWCVFGRRHGTKRNREGMENHDAKDELQRPREKLLLLAGPPGLGKTTLAHVIARQAGYEVMEINASDARTSQAVEDRIRPALESGSAIGSTKPVLIVVDEIDGATGGEEAGFIFKLIQLTLGKAVKKGRRGEKRSSTDKPLRRPIICICNDVNAACLAKLRPHAFQVRISRPADIHVIKRLREICVIEGLNADSRALSTLVGVARGDLRGCLNTLQFIKARGEEVTEGIVRAATSGMKEVDSSVTSILNDLFAPMTRKRVQELGLGEKEESKYVARLSREVQSTGRDANVATGCFTHYITLHQHDATFTRYEQANDWLVTYDSLSSSMYNDGTYELHQYLSYMLVPFYPLFKERGAQRIEKNQTDWEHFQTIQTNEEILKSLLQCLRTACGRHGGDYRHLLTTPTLQLEFLPFINRIISPPIRPVNRQVVKPDERGLLSRLVGIMVSLELRFVQEKSEDGQLVYRLDPPIDVFITYDGKRAPDIAMSRYAVRHLVAGEIDAQLITRQSHATERTAKSSRRDEDDTEGVQEPHPKRPRTNAVDISDKPPTDFFGRPIVASSVDGLKVTARKAATKEFRIAYQYREGSSAAVRRPVKVASFL